MMRAFTGFSTRISRSVCMLIAAALAMLLTLAAPVGATPAQAAPGVPPAEITSLENFFKVMSGPGWHNNTNWLVGDPCLNSWYGITCDPGSTHVIGIKLNCNNLKGGIHRVDLSDLSYLETFDVFINHIAGDIGGFKVAYNTRLVTLRLAGNIIKGNVENLDVRHNPDLVILELGVNYLTGYVDGLDLSGNPKLENLGLQINYIGGDISGLDLSSNPNLEELLLHSNHMKGDPKGMDFSRHPALRMFTIASNRIDGTVPDLTMTSITFPAEGGWLWMCGGTDVVRPSGDVIVDEFADKYDSTWSAAVGCGP